MAEHFVGSKNGAGVKQWIINLMPAHRIYVEAFCGKGVIAEAKRRAAGTVVIDCDRSTISDFACRCSWPGLTTVYGNALEILPLLKVESDWLIYADPPYLVSSRSCKRRYYKHELMTPEEHGALLSVLTALQCQVIISGYWSELYAERLAGWNTSNFWTVNRRGKRVQEFVWFNYPAPAVPFDLKFTGADRHQRQRIKRKAGRWLGKFNALPDAERQFILNSLLTARPAA
ncbi:MAG TPA: DNA adenine methylase [Verrucomicrobiae bacterium]|nr:DNA adenine methylase [Verrucomicrobiae bacterium]